MADDRGGEPQLGERARAATIYAAPFGRFESAHQAEAPANEILVGHQRERARIADWLFTTARHGSLLVTGHRGTGKSKLVDFCLQQFDHDVYKRYLRSTIGRAVFWDWLLIPPVILLALAFPLLLSSGLEIYYANHPPNSLPLRTALLGRLICFPLVLLCAYPLVYGWRTARTVLESPSDTTQPLDRYDSVFVWTRRVRDLLIVGLMGFALVAGGPFAQPAVGAAFLLALVALLYAGTYAASIAMEWGTSTSDPSDASFIFGFRANGHRVTTRTLRRNYIIVWLPIGTALLALPSLDLFGIPSEELVLQYALAAAPLALAGTLLRAFDTNDLRRYLDEQHKRTEPSPRQFDRRILANGSQLTYVWQSVALSLIAVLALGVSPGIVTVGATAIGSLLLVGGLHLRRKLGAHLKNDEAHFFRFIPRSRYVLILKSVFCVTFALQLLSPVFVRLASLWTPPASVAALAEWSPARSILSLYTGGWRRLPGSQGYELRLSGWANLRDEWMWIVTATAVLIAIMFLEYSWIVRRRERERDDAASDPAPSPNSGDAQVFVDNQEFELPKDRFDRLTNARDLAASTFFWLIFSTWMPVLSVRINLGIDNLTHTRVIEAMIAGLRQSYYDTFVSLRSRVGVAVATLQVFASSLLAVALGDHFQRLASKVPQLAWSVFDFDDLRMSGHSRLLSSLLPYRAGVHIPYDAGFPVIEFRAYHVLLFIACFLLIRLVFVTADLYRAHAKDLRELHERLLSTVVQRLQSTVAVGVYNGAKIEGHSGGRSTTTLPEDSRAIELEFNRLLQKVSQPYIQLPIRGHMLSLPAPEVVFIFDELDKIGSSAEVEGSTGDDQTVAQTRDEQHHAKVRALLADMKNLLATASARFIFVGGHNLHDEWLADQTQLRPLLSSIFDLEVYVQTLLSDPVDTGGREFRPSRGVSAFLLNQVRRARHLHLRRKKDANVFDRMRRIGARDLFFVQRPFARIGNKWLSDPGVDTDAPTGASEGDRQKGTAPQAGNAIGYPWLEEWPLFEAGPNVASVPGWSRAFLEQWIDYLTFRSRGVPRALYELVESFVRPTGRVVDHRQSRFSHFDCQHVVYFGEIDRYRAQLVSSIYRELCGSPYEHELSRGQLVRELVRRRDDSVQTAFYLADFLFKFHFRAFSWSNLEKVDGLANVYTGQGTRYLLEQVVNSYRERYVSVVLTGMYDFRFRSEIEAEIRYVSRHSPREMASFNFTLDESHGLRRYYHRCLRAMGKTSASRFEIEVALGEIYDFDGRYDHARIYYEQAIESLDAKMGGAYEASGEKGALAIVLDSKQSATPRRYLQWGITRIRLMLQIGMTFERSRNYEQALIWYRDSRKLSRVMWVAMLDDLGRRTKVVKGDNGEQPAGTDRLEMLKQLPIVYQAFFAFAWVSEKSGVSDDAWIALLDSGLAELSGRLPAVRKLPSSVRRLSEPAPRRSSIPPSKNREWTKHAAFFLSMADLHQATAQLYFFKGNYCDTDGNKSSFYLHRAWHHYREAVLLTRDAIATDDGMLDGRGLSEPVARRIATALCGVAESLVGQISIEGLLQGKAAPSPRPEKLIDLRNWFVKRDGAELDALLRDENADAERVGRYVALTRLAWELLKSKGLAYESAREAIRCAALLETILLCARVRKRLYLALDATPAKRSSAAPNQASTSDADAVGRWLFDQAAFALERADEWLRESVGRDPEFGSTDIDRIPQQARVLAAALALHALEKNDATSSRFVKLLNRWKDFHGQQAAAEHPSPVRNRLRESLQWHVFPTLSRLEALRVLILDAVLKDRALCDEADVDFELLRDLHASYASQAHFTPFLYGSAGGVLGLSRVGDADAMAAHALRFLHRSLAMISSGAAHYETIADLYYLDGDFADREIQTRHCQQLVGNELTCALIRRLEKSKDEERSPASSPPDATSSAPPARWPEERLDPTAPAS